MTNNALRWRTVALASVAFALIAGAARAAVPATVQLERLTWTELRERIAAGATTALLPIGGVEQSGPHMALGKHDVRVQALATEIADKLGNAIVAPVVAYVPEGSIDPPTQHMRFPGTISVPVPAFESVLEGAARSLCHAGFRDVVLLGDHGGYQASLKRVAARLDAQRKLRCRVIALTEYYEAAQAPFTRILLAHGIRADEVGAHAGVADTSLMLAVDPTMVRMDVAAARKPGTQGDGVSGDPRRSSAALGRLGVEHIVAVSVATIRARVAAAH
jgi:creatinine amidohydrolase